MTIVQFPGRLNAQAIRLAMTPSEQIVCANATIVVDERTGELSWFDNDRPLSLIATEQKGLDDR